MKAHFFFSAAVFTAIISTFSCSSGGDTPPDVGGGGGSASSGGGEQVGYSSSSSGDIQGGYSSSSSDGEQGNNSSSSSGDIEGRDSSSSGGGISSSGEVSVSSSSSIDSSSSSVGSVVSSSSSDIIYGSLTYEGQTYKTIVIGTQTWMAENLNYNVSSSRCYKDDPSNCTMYGRLYNWATAISVCPEGWHLPSDSEWSTLVNYAGGSETAGIKLKANSGWNIFNGISGNGTDNYGFSALPGGIADNGIFNEVGYTGVWWSESESGSAYVGNNDAAYARGINSSRESANRNAYDKSSYLFSVRCLQGSSQVQSSSSAGCTAANNTETHYCSNGTMKEREYGILTDSRDNKTYKTVVIGTQTWMAENLNYAASGSKCYENKTDYCDTYGRLYNWATAVMFCPAGWHLPSQAEWDVMTAYIGGSKTEGKKLKATSGWPNFGNGTNDYGFSALPGGYGYLEDGSFYNVDSRGQWWSASEDDSKAAWYRAMNPNDGASWGSIIKSGIFSVRCLQDKSQVQSSSSVNVSSSSSSSSGNVSGCEGFVEGTTRMHYGKDKPQFCDERDGKKYVYVTIGSQTWMAENLNYNSTRSLCYENNAYNCVTYGRLHEWDAAKSMFGGCPSGWRLPSRADWEVMTSYIGGASTEGKKLKETEWSKTGTDEYGFSALPGGGGQDGGTYIGLFDGFWWSADQHEDNSYNAYYRKMYNLGDGADWGQTSKNNLFSVRCIKR